ncbi:MAG: hypothetical protein U9P70_01200 [Patescibacteria group bacterium]|nr:hypothetical protein [Patescibacteria group bacterium]
MITKTYLDGRLNKLEENLKKRINIKDETMFHEIEKEVVSLKKNIKLLEEKIEEDRDIIRNYIIMKNDVKQWPEKNKPNNEKEDVITSDF